MYTIDTLNNLPESLQLVEIQLATFYTAFFAQHSPLSNVHLARFVKDGIQYENNEHYYQHKRAVENADQEKAKEILQAKEPLLCQKVGQNVSIHNPADWENRCLEVMYEGLLAKSEQNHYLKVFLLSTGSTVLLEASPHDMFYGIGLSINHKNIFKSMEWPGGKNWLSKLLAKSETILNQTRSVTKINTTHKC